MSYTELENYIAVARELIKLLERTPKIEITIISTSKTAPTPSVYIRKARYYAPIMITVTADRSMPLDSITRKILVELLRLSLFRAFRALRSTIYTVLVLTSLVFAFAIYTLSPDLGPISVLAVAMGLSSLIEFLLPYIARKKWPDSRIWELHEKAYVIDSDYRDLYDSLYRVIYTTLQLCTDNGGCGTITTRILPPFRYSVKTVHRKRKWCLASLEPISLSKSRRSQH